MEIGDIPSTILATPEEVRIFEAAARGLDLVLTREELIRLSGRITDFFNITGNTARIAAIAAMYAQAQPVHAKEMMEQLALLAVGVMRDPSFIVDMYAAGKIRPASPSKNDTTTTTQPPDAPPPPSTVVSVDFTKRRRR